MAARSSGARSAAAASTLVSQKSLMLRTRLSKASSCTRLAEVAVGLQLVAVDDVRLRLGGGQDDGGDGLEARVALDLGQDLAAVHALGRFRSSRMRSGTGRRRCWRLAAGGRPSPRRRRRRRAGRSDCLASRNASCVSRTSPGLSSTSSTWMACRPSPLRSSIIGRRCCGSLTLVSQKSLMLRTRLSKASSCDGLAEVAVGLQLVALHDVRLGVGRGQDDRRDAT